jgi:hypothetical protein
MTLEEAIANVKSVNPPGVIPSWPEFKEAHQKILEAVLKEDLVPKTKIDKEREECAKIAESYAQDENCKLDRCDFWAEQIVAMIRARKS